MEAASAILSRLKRTSIGTPSGKYATVTTSDGNDGNFAIADDDDAAAAKYDELTIDEMQQMNDELLQQASAALKSTESSVDWLQKERAQAAVQVRALTGDGPPLNLGGPEMPPRRRGCAAIYHRLMRFCGGASSSDVVDPGLDPAVFGVRKQ